MSQGIGHDWIREPPTMLTNYPGTLKDKFNPDEATQYLTNFFLAFVDEMEIALLDASWWKRQLLFRNGGR